MRPIQELRSRLHGHAVAREQCSMPGVDYTIVRQSVPMSRVLEIIGFKAIELKGKQLRGPCPIHQSSSTQSRSFSVNLATNAFRCFKCGAAGNQLDLWRQIHGQTLLDAAVTLCERAQVPVPWSKRLTTDGRASSEKRRGTREMPPLPRNDTASELDCGAGRPDVSSHFPH